MIPIFVFLWVILGFVSIAFWEAYAEGKHGGAAKQIGWEINFHGFKLKAYHFWLWWVTIPLFLTLPLIIVGFNIPLIGILISAYCVGKVVEDFLWFVINPYYGLSKFNSKNVKWHSSWIKLGKVEIPSWYIRNILIAIIVWIVLV